MLSNIPVNEAISFFYLGLVLYNNVIKINGECIVIINEVNVDNPKIQDTEEHIELKYRSSRRNANCALSHYTLMLICGLPTEDGAQLDARM